MLIQNGFPKGMVAILCAGMFATGFADNDWKKDVATGQMNVGSNWGSGSYGQDGTLNRWRVTDNAIAEYLVTFPDAGLEENGSTYVHSMDEGDSVTFDCRNSFWYKGAANYAENSYPFMMTRSGANNQVLFVSGSYKNSANPVFFLTNGLMRYTYYAAGSRFDLLQGTWNLYAPRGTQSNGGLVLDNVNANSTIELHADSHLVSGTVEQRGGSVAVSGGGHQINGDYYLGSKSGRTVTYGQTGGSVTNTGTFYVGHQSSVTANLDLSGDASFVKTGGKLLVANGDSSTARMTLTGQARAEVEETVVGEGASGQGSIELSGSSQMKVSTVLRLGKSSSSSGTVTVGGSAVFTVNGQSADTMIGYVSGAGSVDVCEDGTFAFTTTKKLNVGTVSGTSGSITVRDRGRLTGQSGMNTYLGGGTSASFTVRDQAAVTFPVSTFTMQGTGSRMELQGGSVSFYNLKVGGTDATQPNILRVSGGEHAILNTSTSDDAFSFTTDAARCELLGGSFACRVLKGDDSPELHADGGTLIADTEIRGFARATLGAKGLMLAPPASKTLTCRQTFTDATGVTGVIVKSGEGTLSAAVGSQHGLTRVTGGTLLLGSGVTTFGRSLMVTNGACVSLAGDSTELSVTDLTLGDAVSTGCLVLDSGDTVSVSGTLNLVHAEIDFAGASTVGTYDLFHCTSPVTSSAFDNVRFLHADNAFTRTFDVVKEDDVYVARVTVAERTVSDKTWNGSAGAAWASTENWTPTGVPDEYNSVIFPETASEKNVTFGTVAAYALAFAGGNYVLAGDALAVNGSITSQAGTNRIDAEVRPVMNSLTLTAASGSSLSLGGGIAATSCTDVNLEGTGDILFAGTDAVWSQAFKVNSGSPRIGATEKATLAGGLTPLDGQPLLFAGTGELVVRKGAGTATYKSSAVTVQSGKVTLKGTGRTASRINHEKHLTVGGAATGTAPAAYDVSDILLYRGTQANVMIGNSIPAGGPASASMSLNNGELYARSLMLGRSVVSGNAFTTSFAITNSYAQLDNEFNIGADTSAAGYYNAVRAGANASVKVKSAFNWIGHGDVVFADGALLDATAGLVILNYAHGALSFEHAATFRVQRITAFSGNGVAGFSPTLVFDGGVLDMTSSAVSCVRTPSRRTVRIDGGGLTVNAGADIRHVFTFPFKGTGSVTKTGAGTIVFGKGKIVQSNDGETRADSGLLTADWEGGTTVREGTLVLEADAARTDLAVTVEQDAVLDLNAEDQTLGVLSGAGSVTHAGSLTCNVSFDRQATSATVPTFSDVALARVTVNFNVTDDEPLEKRVAYPLAKLAEGVTFDPGVWRKKNAGKGVSVKFACKDGVVTATTCGQALVLVIK